jgi:YfiR/HmsC-like
MRLNPLPGFGRAARQCARRFYVALMLLLVGTLFSSSFTAVAQQGPLPEYEVKSAFLYNFAKFIQWPPGRFENATDPLVVGIYGKNPFNGFLKALEGKMIGTHKIIIEHVETVADARHCHILFIGLDKTRGARVVEELQGYNVLTVTDEMEIEGFQSVGAVINLTTTANRTVHFEINVDAARRAELKINSSLLNLAKIVRDGRA